MFRPLASFLGRQLLRRAVSGSAAKITGSALDPKFGMQLLRDGRVPLQAKIKALGLGLGAIFVLQTLELPIEAALALLLPIVGIAADFAINGVELLAGPVLIATLALPYLAPRDVVQQIREESEGRLYQAVPINKS